MQRHRKNALRAQLVTSPRHADSGAGKLVVLIALALVAAGVFWYVTQGASDKGSGPQDRGSKVADVSDADPSQLSELPNARNDYFSEVLPEAYSRVEAKDDEWAVEELHEAAKKKLYELRDALMASETIDQAGAARFVSAAARFTPLYVADFAEQRLPGSLSVRRATGLESLEPSFTGRAGFVEALAPLVASYDGASELHVHFKIFRAAIGESSDATSVYFDLSAVTETERIQQNATWNCSWGHMPDGEEVRLTGIELVDLEEVRTPRAAAGFADITEAVLGGTAAFEEQLLPSLDHWRRRLAKSHGISVYGHEGIALGDVNGDGLDDVYVLQPGGLPNRLFLHLADGTVRDASADSGVDFLDLARSAIFCDFDNDGDQDLVIGGGPSIVLAENSGKGQFELRKTLGLTSVYSLSAADYDLDGDLDFYATCYITPDMDGSFPSPYHDANNGKPNALFRNDGGWDFVEVTAEVGLNQNNSRFSFASSWEDYDADGDLDLYVANDFGRNNLYRNDGGSFSDVAGPAGVEDISAGMSVAWGDYNRDGHMDLYVSNMFSSAGQRVTYQRQFKPSLEDAVVGQYQRHARGNSLFENNGDGTFRDVSEDARVTMARWAWGSNFIDLNNDGWEDLVVANGFITNDRQDDL